MRTQNGAKSARSRVMAVLLSAWAIFVLIVFAWSFVLPRFLGRLR